ncbi:YdcF family protein [Flavilitoribacter nigricans]|uniref:Envelope biogenesis factor ElyC n=1 Tax=Flavilitoribacter nigricans (strain ATCC 23147 / DSM 23189 / NBRC 102662 / NCIMB 1420 / SS-2) TaxID=1122177 RepID=A0A2D0N003_FLAN2|nr:ElyC/SanA/YdcF family protein [Flavilitoribacter nigricans]PHN01479.1 envelope biogenesis factor ElyC [Flavilitoribacter nigricans DSM 23189 = NBRC 102662]
MGFFWLLLFSSLFFFRKKRRVFNYLLTAALIWLALVSTPFLPKVLVKSLEWQYEPLHVERMDTASTVHILVLGGGHTADQRLPATDQLSESALKRLVEGIRLNRQLPNSKLILSGFSREGIERSHAKVMAKAALLLGVATQDTAVLTQPWNTMFEAIEYRDRYGNKPKLILVTSAIHLPRAMMHFRRAGLSPVPAPTNYLIKEDDLPKRLKILPSSQNLDMMNKAVHEYVGMFWGKVEWRRYQKGSKH